jgi:hypothetical protein
MLMWESSRPCVQLKKYFTFEVQVLDDKNVRRRFRASNYQVSRCTRWQPTPPPHAAIQDATRCV